MDYNLVVNSAQCFSHAHIATEVIIHLVSNVHLLKHLLCTIKLTTNICSSSSTSHSHDQPQTNAQHYYYNTVR